MLCNVFLFMGGGCCMMLFVINSGGGNNVVACWRASLMVLDICLYVNWNFFDMNIALVC